MIIDGQELARMVCDGCGGFRWRWSTKDRPPCAENCFVEHEENHIDWFKKNRPDACKGREDGDNPGLQPGDKAATECEAYKHSAKCLEAARRKAIAQKATQNCRNFLNKNAGDHKDLRDDYCNQAGK